MAQMTYETSEDSGSVQLDPRVGRKPTIRSRLVIAWRANRLKLQPGLTLAGALARCLPHDMFNHRRAWLYQRAGVRLGRGVQILGPLTLLGWGDIARLLEIGDHSALETPCTISLCAPVRIGRRVHIGMEVMIASGSHCIGDADERCGPYQHEPVEIGDGTWIGARATILPGVSIGPGVVGHLSPGRTATVSECNDART
jgi:carbonic anhydrase/acetyltransferase-like protein (isoleucine patch superfamily)